MDRNLTRKVARQFHELVLKKRKRDGWLSQRKSVGNCVHEHEADMRSKVLRKRPGLSKGVFRSLICRVNDFHSKRLMFAGAGLTIWREPKTTNVQWDRYLVSDCISHGLRSTQL